MATRGDLQWGMPVIHQRNNQNDGSESFTGSIGAILPHTHLGFAASLLLFSNNWLTTCLMFEPCDSSCRQLNMINSTTGSEPTQLKKLFNWDLVAGCEIARRIKERSKEMEV